MKNIIIEVSEAGTAAARTFTYKVIVEGEVVMERTLTPVQTSEAREISSQYFSLLHGGGTGGKGYLPILGDGLFHLFLGGGWQEFGSKILPGGRLVIASTIPEVLQLPWELLRLPGQGELTVGLSDNFSVLRLPKKASELSSSSHELAAGPLRVLFLSADPQDFEEEELSILRAAEGVDMQLQICDTGTREELKSLAEAFRPHLVHLSGEGKMTGGEALFSLQDPGGRPDSMFAEELAAALKNSGTECVILGGRKSEPTPVMEMLCQKLAEHLPMAVAWNGPVSSSPELYRSLAAGKSLEEVLRNTVREMLKLGRERGTIEAYPVLYSTSEQSGLFTLKEKVESAAIIYEEQQALPGMTEGHAEGFVNRRRDLQRLLPAIREGSMHTLIITGPPGSGKSTLATHLARSLATLGYSILPIYGSPNNPISAARLLEAAGSQITAIERSEELKGVKNPALPVGERLKSLMEVLKANRILMVWDDLNLDGKTGKISDPPLAEFYLQMIKGMTISRAIITCQAVPADAVTLPSLVREWKLDGLSEAAFIRFILRDELAADRYRKGEVSYADLSGACSSYGKDLALLDQTRRALRTGVYSGDGDPVVKLSASLSPESRNALSRAAVYAIGMIPAGFAAVAGISEDAAIANLCEWQDLSLSYRVGKLWAVPSSARFLLLAGLSPEEQQSTQKKAGDFQRDLAESGRCAELVLSRLDCLLEARGNYIAAADLEEAIAVTARISGYLERRGYHSELIRLNQELLARQPNAESMNWIAQGYADQFYYTKAVEWYTRALEAAPNALSHQGMGMAYLGQRKYDQAKESLQKALEIFLAEGNRAGEAASLQGLASIDMVKKENAAAQEKLQKVAGILDSLGDQRGEAATLQEMARLDMIRRDYESARPRFLKSLELLRAMNDRAGEAYALFNLASLDQEKNDFALAEQEFQEALSIARELGDRRGEAANLHSLGVINSQAGEKEKATRNFREALRIFQELNDQPGEAGAFFQLGVLAVQSEKVQEGLRLMALSAVVLRNIKSGEVKNVEPMVERLASQLSYTQEQFMVMLQEVMQGYVKDRGSGLVDKALGK